MKKFLPILASVVLFAACNTGQKKDLDVSKDFLLMDTAKLYPSNVSSDTGVAIINDIPSEPVATTPAPRPTPKKRVVTQQPVYRDPVVTTPQPTANPAPTTNPAPGTTASTGTKSDTAATVATKKKEGWSDAAKGATIGGVGGAVVGAVIGKNAKGAAVGAVIGAAGGYILGRKRDKASGRVDTTKKN